MSKNNQNNIISNNSFITEVMTEVPTNQQHLVVDLFISMKSAISSMTEVDLSGVKDETLKTQMENKINESYEKFANEMTKGIVQFTKLYLESINNKQ